jgi:hypothetical protein
LSEDNSNLAARVRQLELDLRAAHKEIDNQRLQMHKAGYNVNVTLSELRRVENERELQVLRDQSDEVNQFKAAQATEQEFRKFDAEQDKRRRHEHKAMRDSLHDLTNKFRARGLTMGKKCFCADYT